MTRTISLLPRFLRRVFSRKAEPAWIEDSGPAWTAQRTPTPATLLSAYRDTAYFCANLNARGVAKATLRVYVMTRPGETKPKCTTAPIARKAKERLSRHERLAPILRAAENVNEVTDHPLVQLFAQPCRHDGAVVLTRFDLFELTQLYLEVVGVSYWLVQRNRLGVPTSVWLLHPLHVRPVAPAGDALPTHYQYGVGATKRDYPARDVLVFRTPDPSDPYAGGYSPLRSAFDRIGLTQDYLKQAQSFLANRARPDSIISPSQPDGVIGEPEARRLEATFNHRFRGAGAGGVYVARDSLKVDPLSFSPRDLGELAETTFNNEQIARAFDIPLSLLNRDANRANAEQGRAQHVSDALAPRLARLEERVNAQLVPMFDPTGRLFVAFDEPAPENVLLALRARETNLRLGVTTINEERLEDGRPPVPWGETPLRS